MRWRISLYVVLIVCPVCLYAGPIFGSIFFNNAALRGASIQISCGGSVVASGSTLDDGSYRINVPNEGRCTLSVTSNNIQASADVVSSSSASRFNFVVVRRNGGYELRRQ
jgi:hypothetical protein